VNVLGVVLGVAAATSDTRVVLVAGLAATFSESVSMAAVAYTATRAEADLYRSELEREHRHVRAAPAQERDEIREIYRAKGLSGDLLDRVVDAVTANRDVWVAVMMAEEHHLAPVRPEQGRRSAVVVGASALLGSLIPLAPFMLLPVSSGMWASAAVAAVSLFIVGWYKARVTVGSPGRSGLEIALIGMVSALVGFAVGWIFKVAG
jgi:vacuolar iron transporter family protein